MLEEDRKKMKRKEMRERKKMYYYMNKKVKMSFKIIDLLYGEILNIIFPWRVTWNYDYISFIT